jgi:murein DD-endopeptidase MepM/ murein hydrolase activator NlpD
VPEHLHTGVDILRPNNNFENEPVYSAGYGMVISVRDDGPFAQIIIEHQHNDGVITWAVYEHVAGIMVLPGDRVNPFETVARFMNREELDHYGWQFNHIHFEVLKVNPIPANPTHELPNRFFTTYWDKCYTEEILGRYYIDPMELFVKDQ